MASEDKTKTVLSIQSHVVHGHVGNTSAVFPLQLLGFEVDAINSVQFCNHTWYQVTKGQVMNADELGTLYDGLKANNLDRYDYILTGYIGAESFLLKISDMITEMKQKNPNLIYVCDPVMGDDGVMYVPEGLLAIYREKILPLADVILPNQWEAEKLSNSSITCQKEALSVMKALQEKGPSTVVLTSSNIENESTLTSFALFQKGQKCQCVKIDVPKIDAMFIGAGDLFAALWLAWSHDQPDNVKFVAMQVQSTMQHVLKRTINYAKKMAGESNKPNWAQVELRLIQSKKDIEDPEIIVQAENV